MLSPDEESDLGFGKPGNTLEELSDEDVFSKDPMEDSILAPVNDATLVRYPLGLLI